MQFKIEGMTCEGCVGAVERVAKRVPGVVAARAKLEEKRLDVEGTPDASAVIAAVDRAGYKASVA